MDAVPSSRLKLDRLKYEKEHNYNNSLLSSDSLSLLHGLSSVGDAVVSSTGSVADTYNGAVVIASRGNNHSYSNNIKSDIDEDENDEEEEYDLESNPSEEGVSGQGADSSLSNDSYSTSSLAKRSMANSNPGSSCLLSTSLTMGSANRASYNSTSAASNSLVVPAGSAQLTMADRRAHHNSLERKRREHIKSSFNGLRDAIPSMVGEKVSRSQILRKAGEYIQSIKRKTSTLNEEVDELRRQNALLDQQIKQLERAQQHQQPQDNANNQPVSTMSSTQQRFQSVTIQPLQQQHQQQVHATGGLLLSNGHVFRVAPPAMAGILEGTSDQQIIVNGSDSGITSKKAKTVVSFVNSQLTRGGV